MNKQKTLTALFEELSLQTTILTPNRRLAATLHKYYQADQINIDKLVWQTPDILPINTWIERLWLDHGKQSFTSLPYLLNSTQEQFLWENIISANKEKKPILQLGQTAQLAKSAAALLKQWRVHIDEAIFKNTPDYAAFYAWMGAFNALIKKEHWLDQASLIEILTPFIAEKKLKIKSELILIGFTEISPALNYLLTACEKANCQVIHLSINTKVKKNCHKLRLKNSEDEIISSARFAKHMLKQYPQAKIGCVIPNLDKIRNRVWQIFSSVFNGNHVFNLSAGKSLLQYPILQAAIHLLSLHKKKTSLHVLSYILTSPFLGDAEDERIKRSQLEKKLRQNNNDFIDASGNGLISCEKLNTRLQAFFKKIEEYKNNYRYEEWAAIFSNLLKILGWPGERSLNSEEYQVAEAWMNTLDSFASLDTVSPPVKFSVALAQLQKILKNITFQPKTPDAPIQILGILEAAGLPFDYLWVMGMDDLSFPPKPSPNPLIPKSLQRELHMPHATSERELLFCQLLLKQFMQNANISIFSYAEKNEELELQESPLLEELSPITLEELNLPPYLAPNKQIFKMRQLEKFIDHQAPSLNPNEKIVGGINIIKQQALCPFKAFAEWRLHAQEAPSPTPGLRAKDRGTIIHKALELIWNKLITQANLSDMEDKALDQLIIDGVSSAFASTTHAKEEWQEYLALEKKRLQKLLKDWLIFEKNRPPFKVLHHEKKLEIELKPLKLTLRVDRIDELENGKKIIIDYKTGKNNEIGHWFSERPNEPQLPLYALLDKENTIGISFAEIKPGEPSFKGISAYDVEMKGIKLLSQVKKSENLSWEAQQLKWDSILKNLSEHFYHGDAKVDPKDGKQTCTYCALKPLCRINDEIYEN